MFHFYPGCILWSLKSKHLLDLSRAHSEEDFSHCEGRSVLSSKQSDGAPVSKSSQTYIGISAWQVFAINYALL